MAENWAAIAAEIGEAIASVGFPATITRPGTGGPQTPEQVGIVPAPAPVTFEVTVIDDGIKDRYAPGGLVTRQARVLTIAATGVVPQKKDTITVRGKPHVIQVIMPLAPGGVDLLYEAELES